MKHFMFFCMALTMPFLTTFSSEVKPTGNILIEGDYCFADSQNQENIILSMYVYDMRGNLVLSTDECGSSVCSILMTSLSSGSYVVSVDGSLADFSDTVFWPG